MYFTGGGRWVDWWNGFIFQQRDWAKDSHYNVWSTVTSKMFVLSCHKFQTFVESWLSETVHTQMCNYFCPMFNCIALMLWFSFVKVASLSRVLPCFRARVHQPWDFLLEHLSIWAFYLSAVLAICTYILSWWSQCYALKQHPLFFHLYYIMFCL